MAFVSAPPLPSQLAFLLPSARGGYRLEHGLDAGRRLHWVETGAVDAPPVVLVHGNPTWSFLWRKVMAGLGALRALAPDLLGFGLSDKPRRVAEYSLRREGDALVEWIEALALQRIILVGQDWGGPIVTYIGSRLPERIAGLVLANTSVLPPPLHFRTRLFHRVARVPVVSTLLFRGLRFPLYHLSRAQGTPTSIAGEVARAYRWPFHSWAARAGPLALARMVPHQADHPSLKPLAEGTAWATTFGGPVGLIWGQRDPLLGTLLARHERAFPQAEVVRTDAGHFLQEEVPERFAALILEIANRADS